ncbi:MAG TPA: hypothetical protein VKF40_05480 [Burkholderiales bacterium]|nr:hypothetical protein [Burkholderiales bacterium]
MEQQDKTNYLARIAAALLFVLLIVTGYVISPQVQGAVGLPHAAQDQETVESYVPSQCVVDGLVFSDCFLDF